MSNEYLNNKSFESLIHGFQYQSREKKRFEMMIKDFRETYDRRKAKYSDEQKKPQLDSIVQKYEASCAIYQGYRDQLAHAFYLLSENIANYARYQGVDFDDAVQEGVLICFEKIDRFDPRKGKAFNYLTTCVLNNFRQMYRSARNYTELKRKYLAFLQYKFESLLPKNPKDKQNFKDFSA
jgi:DNA-directed RNA polymerase specialized sigma subunit